MTSNIRREIDSLGKRPLSIVIIIPRMAPCVRSLVETRETVRGIFGARSHRSHSKAWLQAD
jgi:hypothetical protein